ncbi:uncharacterized protein N7483_007346 [Penicillium malachiteum]|uniref:uncharacterized protein n=1 Tax=Penicillium malachiteum TaxID=1324776 RepID=UPI002547C67E|nr:uncharacterized protein N7483_007346 [Penicillium malachiteum]KAJ5725989.1 hypothetical protein N7483_007346 [Penicillium malachiteum]
MSHFYPTAEYAEEQPLARTILATHVASRGFQLGTALGLISGTIESVFRRRAITIPLLLRSAGAGSIIGAGIATVGMIGRMWGREGIEWADRSWRLRYNTGQLAIDNWSEPGAVMGALAVALRRPSAATLGGWRGVVGGAGIGSLVGLIGCISFTEAFQHKSK